MKPYHERDGITLYLGSALDVLRQMPDESVNEKQTFRFSRAGQDAIFCDKMHIVFPDFQVYAYSANQIANMSCDVHASYFLNDISHIDDCLFLKSIIDFEPIDQNSVWKNFLQNSGYFSREYFSIATNHSNGTHKTGHVVATNFAYISFFEIHFRIHDKLTGFLLFSIYARMSLNNILPDDSGVHLLARTLFRMFDMFFSSYCYQVYRKYGKTSNHFAVFPHVFTKQFKMGGLK